MSEFISLPLPQKRDYLARFAETNDPGMRRELLEPLIAPDNRGFFTCLGPLFRGAVFGRDSIKMARDILAFAGTDKESGEPDAYGQLAKNVILTLASLQGVKDDPRYSEERPGKIHHEYRHRSFDADDGVQHTITTLRDKQEWMPPESDSNELCYYGSADSTPLFIKLVRLYIGCYKHGILAETITARSGEQKTIAACVADAATFIHDEIGRSPSGLLEHKRTNPNGLVSQSWKDSPDGFLHIDGTRANYEGGVAALDVQGYAYDALRDAAVILPFHPQLGYWTSRANNLHRRTLDKLWLPQQGHFAQGLDYDDTGRPRQIATFTSENGVFLGSKMLQESGPVGRMAQQIAEDITSSEFTTEAGFRLRAIGHRAIERGWHYHGSLVTWPKETNDILFSLEKQGHKWAQVAARHRNAFINACVRSGTLPEFWHVSADNVVTYDYETTGVDTADFIGNSEAHDPQILQGWTVTAFLNGVHKRHQLAMS